MTLAKYVNMPSLLVFNGVTTIYENSSNSSHAAAMSWGVQFKNICANAFFKLCKIINDVIKAEMMNVEIKNSSKNSSVISSRNSLVLQLLVYGKHIRHLCGLYNMNMVVVVVGIWPADELIKTDKLTRHLWSKGLHP